MSVTIIVPTFNEGDNVEPLVQRIAAVSQPDWQVLFVDDSTDDTPTRIEKVIAEGYMPVRMIHREGEQKTGGLGGAVVAGLRAVNTEYALVMDGDLQHPPETIPDMLAAVADRDIVVASRYVGDGDASGLANGTRRLVSTGATMVTRAMFPKRLRQVTDPMTGFFVIRRSAVDIDSLKPSGFKILLEILARHTLRVGEVPFTFAERLAGESKAGWTEGGRFIRQLAQLRFGKASGFAAVGAFGTALNLALMWALINVADVHYLQAAITATAVTIVSNFVMHETLVFKDLRSRAGMLHRLGASLIYNGIEAVVRTLLLGVLVSTLGWHAVSTQAVLLAVAFVLRFVFTSRVIYKQREPRGAASLPRPEIVETEEAAPIGQ